MPVINFPIIGPTYTNRSLPVSAQITRNMFVEYNQQGTEPISLKPFWGLKKIGSAGNGPIRGMGEYSGALYVVSGQELYRFNNNNTSTLIGEILGSIGVCWLMTVFS